MSKRLTAAFPAGADWNEHYAANLHSRTVKRILLRLTKGTYRTERDIYKLAKNINWFNWFTLQQTFKVKIEAKRANVKSLQFAA